MRRLARCYVLCLWSALLVGVCSAADEHHVYSTRAVLEFDACASAWLIKRFVDPEAVFRFYPSGALITEGTPFNTPEASWRRTQTMSTYETILRDAKLDDAALSKIGDMVHEIELTYSRSYDTEASAFNERIRSLIQQESDPARALERSFAELDRLYESFKNDPASKTRN